MIDDRLMFIAQRETQGVPRDVAEKEWGERMKISDEMIYVAREAYTFAHDSDDMNREDERWCAALEAVYPLIREQVMEEAARIATTAGRYPVDARAAGYGGKDG